MKKTLVLASLSSIAAGGLFAQTDTEVKLPAVTVYSPHVANQDPVGTFAMPVTALRFDSRVDVQARNLAEGQADVSIRGGIFENTGFKVGSVGLYDPQTGHYLAEIPIAPSLLTAPEILTGSANANTGFNANVGTVRYGWRQIKTQGYASVAAGEFSSNRQEFYQGYSKELGAAGARLGMDVAFARSESAGAIAYGDHYFQRYNGRLQLISAAGQTDLVAAYQGKFFGWPNMYTPFNVKETENLQTVLFVLNHEKKWDNGDSFQAGAYWRRNKDDYEYDRTIPGRFNPYKHTTYVYGFSLEGRSSFGLENFSLLSSAQAMFDRIDSTSLTYGPYRHRDYYKLSLVPEGHWKLADGSLFTTQAGASFDDTNKGPSAVSPIFELARTVHAQNAVSRTYLSFARSSQVPSYTAIKSNPNGGLFRGNPRLGRTTSDNIELGSSLAINSWKLAGAVFWRNDDQLVDWTYTNSATTARTANAVDICTAGFELSATRSWQRFDLVMGYTGLTKDEDYGSTKIDASFYALNYPKHRLTAALVAKLGAGVELRLDNEARFQNDNILRRSQRDEYFLSSLGLAWHPAFCTGLTVSGQIDNLWDSSFEEVPAVPASPRQASVAMAYAW